MPNGLQHEIRFAPSCPRPSHVSSNIRGFGGERTGRYCMHNRLERKHHVARVHAATLRCAALPSISREWVIKILALHRSPATAAKILTNTRLWVFNRAGRAMTKGGELSFLEATGGVQKLGPAFEASIAFTRAQLAPIICGRARRRKSDQYCALPECHPSSKFGDSKV